MSAFSLLVLAALLMLPDSAHAQRPEAPFAPGTRIRLRLPGSEPLIGTVATDGMNGLRLVRMSGDTIAVPREALGDVEVSLGRRSNSWKGAKYGAILGSGVGILIAALDDAQCQSCEMDLGPAIYPIGALLFGTLGGGVGLLAGSISRTERWTRVRVEVDLVTDADAGADRICLGLAARF